jgi:formylglycine-generating enzyme required for sulfatase activity
MLFAMPTIFVSYRRHDSADATGRLYDRLKAHFGSESIFFDVDAIPIGVDFRKHLSDQVGKCDVFLAVIGDGWLKSRFQKGSNKGQRRIDDPADWVRIEIEAALARGIPLVPVLVGRASMPSDTDLPDSLKELAFRHAVEVRSGGDYDGQADRLIRGLDRILLDKDTGATREKIEQRPIATEPTQIEDVHEQRYAPNPGKLEPKPGEFIANSLGMMFAWISPGTFLMGSPKTEAAREHNETQHKVTLSKGFYMGIHPVTRGQFAIFVQKTGFKTQAELEGGAHIWTGNEWKLDPAANWRNPGFEQTNDHPVTCVSWFDAVAFAEWLAQQDNKRIRLPTEAEWEYSCRAGTNTPFHFGDTISTEQANYDGNYTYGRGTKGKLRQKTTPVGSFPANAWGLFDMHGNVWEWCQDWIGDYPGNGVTDPHGPESGQYRALHGGCWRLYPQRCRSACRDGDEPRDRHNNCGFRLCFCLD